MNGQLERMYSPKEVAELGILCLASQWKQRKLGRLQFYRLGRKVIYGQKHLDAYLAFCESGNANSPDNRTSE